MRARLEVGTARRCNSRLDVTRTGGRCPPLNGPDYGLHPKLSKLPVVRINYAGTEAPAVVTVIVVVEQQKQSSVNWTGKC